MAFFQAKSWWKYDIYWLLKSSCFDLFGDGKYGLFWVKKLMERLYLLVTEKFLFCTFRWWEIRSFFESKSWWKEMIFTGYWQVFVLNFSVMGNTVFFHPKSWWKDDIYLVFFSFPWYSSTWEIWFFVQCLKKS